MRHVGALGFERGLAAARCVGADLAATDRFTLGAAALVGALCIDLHAAVDALVDAVVEGLFRIDLARHEQEGQLGAVALGRGRGGRPGLDRIAQLGHVDRGAHRDGVDALVGLVLLVEDGRVEDELVEVGAHALADRVEVGRLGLAGFGVVELDRLDLRLAHRAFLDLGAGLAAEHRALVGHRGLAAGRRDLRVRAQAHEEQAEGEQHQDDAAHRVARDRRGEWQGYLHDWMTSLVAVICLSMSGAAAASLSHGSLPPASTPESLVNRPRRLSL
jgi:hypothetical protein